MFAYITKPIVCFKFLVFLLPERITFDTLFYVQFKVTSLSSFHNPKFSGFSQSVLIFNQNQND